MRAKKKRLNWFGIQAVMRGLMMVVRGLSQRIKAEIWKENKLVDEYDQKSESCSETCSFGSRVWAIGDF